MQRVNLLPTQAFKSFNLKECFMKTLNLIVATTLLFSSLNLLAMGPSENKYSISGDERSQAARYFNKFTKITPSCAYAENVKVKGEIMAVLCKQLISEYACEISSMGTLPDEACR